ncbi:UDP-N-acetylmuramoyl-tripeptide--D-alanyl-D-alanine ligase [Frankia canadensis]|uniref:UDP-N-acetylmuramoyl-tripeptide--D-alanyl-D-alanine ligase n=1 Tax=Frankia canadensis TaxID=1836972 RepID=A0A2I2KJ13_9ACTN|nr:UDP-N-acetylmuramoyl-tripeptide--D-alanyl-D-alanine ligase [Frankia canadensis]SNQ45646.1 UDP-N-acetylmuramoyl-tripeptide--D-alanyl-D-alanine ligase [Frankia canadensis]SOU52936.1 UDP-N-acetylmuramoyl-tripeptide--D-alanyl-D-alanine ligase [Frankia canadensis]
MIPLTLAEVAAATGGRLDAQADPAAVVRAVSVDSRAAGPGTLFVALAGSRVDGHDFATAASAAGAVAVLAARPVGVPAVVVADPHAALAALAAHVRDLAGATVVAVTGSAGKTTTKDLIADLLAELGPTVAAPGSFNNEIGLPLTLLRTEPDTAFVVLEMGARGLGHIATLCAVARPAIGAVLNVGSAHVGEYADGRAGIAAAKGELAEAASDAVVLNADDPLVAAMAARAGAGAEVLTFGAAPGADVRADGEIRVDGTGRASFTLVAGGECHPVTLGLVGAHQVPNALAAAAVALRLGLAPARIAAALGAARPRSRWRMEVTSTRAGVVVVNDAYNANPESMAAALRTLVAMRPAGGRAIAVLGGMGELGDAADDEHDALGRLAARLGVDRLVAVGSATRRVDEAARRDGAWTGESVWVADVDEAVAAVVALARPDDAVLVKASRSYGLERVAADVVAKFGVDGDGIEGT